MRFRDLVDEAVIGEQTQQAGDLAQLASTQAYPQWRGLRKYNGEPGMLIPGVFNEYQGINIPRSPKSTPLEAYPHVTK